MKIQVKFAWFSVLLIALVLIAGCSSAATSTPAPAVSTTTSAAVIPPSTPVAQAPQTSAATTVKPSSPAISTTNAAPTPSTSTPPKPPVPQLLLASTTSTRDSGLMDAHDPAAWPGFPWQGLIPLFQQQTGYQVKSSYVGSGAAIALGQAGNADVLLVHSPAAEVAFVQSGYGFDRRLIMHNDFIIVGPPSDPAKINGTVLATDALKKIAAAGAKFYSRGDNSGTDVLEKGLWTKIGVSVKDGSSTNPSWYIEGGAGAGMLDLLKIASEKGGYTIADRASMYANQKILNLNIQVQGDPALLNVYHVITVNPAKFSNISINVLGARAFADFMTSPDIQSLVSTYGVAQYGQSLFVPDFGKTESSLGSQ
jgi:tungstate transport system substrate-binding protein